MLKIESNENTKGTRNFSILQYSTYFEKGKLQGYFLFLLNFLFCLQVSSLGFKWKKILTGPLLQMIWLKWILARKRILLQHKSKNFTFSSAYCMAIKNKLYILKDNSHLEKKLAIRISWLKISKSLKIFSSLAIY